jgi:predicted dehydrogenase
MTNVKIFGAGSIGNHLAFACRSKGWQVTMVDLDPKALQRTQEEIYPSRYGRWDAQIRLAAPSAVAQDPFDLVIVGTPPDSHLKIALAQMRACAPKVMLVEKPLCTPDLHGATDLVQLSRETGTFVGTGYNHTLTPNTVFAGEILAQGWMGKVATISAAFREYWGGIFGAHPWLSGPKDTYLGFSQRGGGASGEHSHAINIWQHFAHATGAGRVMEVSALLDMVETDQVAYDRVCQIHVKTATGLVGTIVQDVVTEPAQKQLRIQGETGFLEWLVNYGGSQDAVRWQKKGAALEEKLFPKKRPDDFKGEIDHAEAILQGRVQNSPIALERGLESMMVVAAAHVSHRLKRTVAINYEAGWTLEAIQPA